MYHGGPMTLPYPELTIVPTSAIARVRLDPKLIAIWFSRWISFLLRILGTRAHDLTLCCLHTSSPCGCGGELC